jgi:hypothetical protein
MQYRKVCGFESHLGHICWKNDLLETGGHSSRPAPAPATTLSATATPSVVAKSYSNNERATMVTKLKGSNGRAFTVIPAAQIDQGLQVARTLLKTAVINPKACATPATQNSQVPEGST